MYRKKDNKEKGIILKTIMCILFFDVLLRLEVKLKSPNLEKTNRFANFKPFIFKHKARIALSLPVSSPFII